MTERNALVIIGGSYAAANIVAGAREAGLEGPIALISAESHLPYQRPPLSKAYLLGKVEEASLPIRAETYYQSQGVTLHLGREAVRIDRERREVTLADGEVLPYERLAIATGARARLLPIAGADLDGVMTLRSLDDARALRQRLGSASRAVVIGGGFIGLEAAASMRQLGLGVTVLESRERLLARAVSAPLAAFMSGIHAERGVVIERGVQVSALAGEAGKVSGVTCADGRVFAADLVIVGIGSIPNDELAVAAGLACSDGIVVDQAGRSSDPAIFAAGDCTRHPSRYWPQLLRLESVQNATDQGRAVGRAEAGQAVAYDAVPWFWSDQYEFKLQMAGLLEGGERCVRREAEGGAFSLFHYRQEKLVAVESVNRPADHLLARKLLGAGIDPDPALVADPGADLKGLVSGVR